MIIRKFVICILLNFSIFGFTQSNHFLRPIEHPLFSNLNSDYYYLIRAKILRNENPTLALLKTSHLPESMLYVLHDINTLEYTINYKTAKSSIWEIYFSNSKSKIDVIAWKKKIDSDSYEILKKLFNHNLYNTKFDPDYKEYFDGEQYLFSCDRKTGFIDAVADDSDIAKTIKICDKIVAEIKKSESNTFSFSTELLKEIEFIIDSRNKK